jgi:hypothetical protein
VKVETWDWLLEVLDCGNDTNPLAKTFTFIFVTDFHVPEIFNIRPKRGVSTLKQKTQVMIEFSKTLV